MGWFDKKPSTEVKETWVEVDQGGYFYHYINSMFSGNAVERFDPTKSLHFATTLAEIFIPIDAIADRVASCDFVLYNKNTKKKIRVFSLRFSLPGVLVVVFLTSTPTPIAHY